MKRSLTLLLASLLLVFTLTACGRNDSQNNAGQNNGTTVGDNAVTGNPNGGTANDAIVPDNGVGNGTNNGVTGNGDTIGEDIGGAIQNGVDNVEDALTGNHNANGGTTNQTSTRTGGVTYEEMLQNGRVHDTNGILTDRENTARRTY